MFCKERTVNGYGMRRIDYSKPNISIGFTNKVYMYGNIPLNGMCYFLRTETHSICIGYVTLNVRSGLHFKGNAEDPFKYFKLVFFNKFIGGTSPKWLKRIKRG